jgi:hypothetical protein
VRKKDDKMMVMMMMMILMLLLMMIMMTIMTIIGPGSSSILGMLEEVGPLIVNASGGLSVNPYAWTTRANLLVLESPAGPCSHR